MNQKHILVDNTHVCNNIKKIKKEKKERRKVRKIDTKSIQTYTGNFFSLILNKRTTKINII